MKTETTYLGAIKNFIIYGLGSVAQSAVGFLLIPLFTQTYSPEMFGQYTIIWIIGSVFSSFLYLGIASALPKFFYQKNDVDNQSQVFSSGYFVVLLSMLLQIAIATLCSGILSVVFFNDAQLALPIFFSITSGAVTFFIYYLTTFIRALEKAILFVFINIAIMIVTIALTNWLFQSNADVLAAPFIAVLITNILFAVAISIYLRWANWLRLVINQEVCKQMIYFGFPMAVSSIASLVVDWSDRLIIEHFSGLAGVGIYSLAYKMAAIVNIILVTPFAQLWAPFMMKVKENHNSKEIFRIVFKIYWWASFSILIFFIIFYEVISPLIIRSKDYGDIFMITLLLTSGLLFYGLSNIVCCGLMFSSRTKLIMWINYIGAALNIILCLSMIPFWGVQGAAIATTISYIIIPVLMHLASKKYFDFQPFAKSSIRLLISMCILIFILILNRLGFLDYIATKVILSVLSIVAITLILFWKEFLLYKNRLRKEGRSL